MKVVITNILGAIVGVYALWFIFPIVLRIIAYIIEIPVLGDIIRFGTEPAYIVFPYSAVIASVMSASLASIVCQPSKSGKKIGVTTLGVWMLLQFGFTTISLFQHNGYAFVFVVFAAIAAFCSFSTIVVGLTSNKKDSVSASL